jgi:hypothetical protein
VGVYPIPKKHSRKRNRKLTDWGRGSYINGYPFIWTLIRCVLVMKRGEGVVNSLYLPLGFLEYWWNGVERNDVADFVYKYRMDNIKARILPFVFKRGIRLAVRKV